MSHLILHKCKHSTGVGYRKIPAVPWPARLTSHHRVPGLYQAKPKRDQRRNDNRSCLVSIYTHVPACEHTYTYKHTNKNKDNPEARLKLIGPYMPCSEENLRIFTGIAQRAFWRPECGKDLDVTGRYIPSSTFKAQVEVVSESRETQPALS